MQHLDFNFDIEKYNNYVEDGISLEGFLEEVFDGSDIGDSSYDSIYEEQVKNMLLRHHSDNSGSPQIVDFNISDAIYDEKIGFGRVNLNYEVEFCYSCSDQNTFKETHENIQFEIDLKNAILKLYFITYERPTMSDE